MKPIKAILIIAALLFTVSAQAAAVKEITSPSGIKAWLVEDKSLPVVSVAFYWRGGVELDSEKQQGLSYLATALLTKGAGKDDADVFEKKLLENAITLNFDARRDGLSGQFRSLKETLPVATALLAASLSTPRFDDKNITLMKQQSAAQRNMYKADPDWLLSRLMIASVFEGHPYFLRTLGTEASMGALHKKDLQQWMKRLSRDKLVVAVAGDITENELGILLDKTFGLLPAQSAGAPLKPAALKNLGETILLQQEGPQTHMALVWEGIPRDDAQRYALEVMNYIFGGGSFSSRLMEEVRDKRGLTYGISSGPDNYDAAALYTVQVASKNENAGEVLKLIETEMDKLVTQPVSADELQAAKDYLIGAYALSRTSTMKVAAYYADVQRLKRSADEEHMRAEAIRTVSAADVQALAVRLFKDKKKAVLVVGAPQGLSPTKTLTKID